MYFGTQEGLKTEMVEEEEINENNWLWRHSL
jgi:hypothetical protein